MVWRGLVLAGIIAVLTAAPANAGVLTAGDVAGAGFLQFEDPAGVPDDLRVVSTVEPTITVLGATVAAGKGCVPVPGGASCTRPAATVAWDFSSIDTGAGDDRVVVETLKEQAQRIFGGDGNDQITFAASTVGSQYGMDGNDVLTAAGEARLEGGPGNDVLSVGAASGLSGGPGTDRLNGSPQSDVLVDAGDAGSRDVIACLGGEDVVQSDRTDTREGCAQAALDAISKVDFYWRVRFRQRLSVPTRLRVAYTPHPGLQGAFADCIGAPCHRAKFNEPAIDKPAFRIVSGGKRIRLNGRNWRGVSPGAIVRVGLEFTFGDVVFTKGLEFRTRARKLPTYRKRCTVTLLDPPRTGPTRVVPCT